MDNAVLNENGKRITIVFKPEMMTVAAKILRTKYANRISSRALTDADQFVVDVV